MKQIQSVLEYMSILMNMNWLFSCVTSIVLANMNPKKDVHMLARLVYYNFIMYQTWLFALQVSVRPDHKVKQILGYLPKKNATKFRSLQICGKWHASIVIAVLISCRHKKCNHLHLRKRLIAMHAWRFFFKFNYTVNLLILLLQTFCCIFYFDWCI